MSSDFTLNFNDDEQVPKKIHLHKIILMVYSDYFNKYFTTALVKDKSQSALNFWVFDSYDFIDTTLDKEELFEKQYKIILSILRSFYLTDQVDENRENFWIEIFNTDGLDEIEIASIFLHYFNFFCIKNLNIVTPFVKSLIRKFQSRQLFAIINDRVTRYVFPVVLIFYIYCSFRPIFNFLFY